MDSSGNFRVRLEQCQEVPFAVPDLHRVRLHHGVGFLTAQSGLGEGQENALGVDQAAQLFEIAPHVVGIDDEFFDHAGQPVQSEVEGDRRVGCENPLDR